MTTKDAQARKMMEEFSKHGKVGLSALRSGMDRKTATKYLDEGRLPSELKKERHWRTREDSFAGDWDEIVLGRGTRETRERSGEVQEGLRMLDLGTGAVKGTRRKPGTNSTSSRWRCLKRNSRRCCGRPRFSG